MLRLHCISYEEWGVEVEVGAVTCGRVKGWSVCGWRMRAVGAMGVIRIRVRFES